MGMALFSVLRGKVSLRAGFVGFVVWTVPTCNAHPNLLTGLGAFLQLNGKRINIIFDASLVSLWLFLSVFSSFGSGIYGLLLTDLVPKYPSNN
jgi:hypothetical protein